MCVDLFPSGDRKPAAGRPRLGWSEGCGNSGERPQAFVETVSDVTVLPTTATLFLLNYDNSFLLSDHNYFSQNIILAEY